LGETAYRQGKSCSVNNPSHLKTVMGPIPVDSGNRPYDEMPPPGWGWEKVYTGGAALLFHVCAVREFPGNFVFAAYLRGESE
jgi:hypothetical protein